MRKTITLPDGATLTAVLRPAKQTTGNGSTARLLLLPGTFGDSEVYDLVLPHLDPRLDLAMVGFRGHAGDRPIPENSSMESLTEDTLAAADAIGWDRFYIGGHSLGGMVSVDMLRAAPDRLLGSIPIEGWTVYNVAEDAFAGIVTAGLPEDLVAKRQAIRERVLEGWTEEQRKEFATIWRRWNGYESLKSTTLPVLEIWGDRGRPRPSLEVMRIPDRENIRVAWMAGASHSLLLERPKEVAGAINAFVAETGGLPPE